jgi:hypothetical protein
VATKVMTQHVVASRNFDFVVAGLVAVILAMILLSEPQHTPRPLPRLFVLYLSKFTSSAFTGA